MYKTKRTREEETIVYFPLTPSFSTRNTHLETTTYSFRCFWQYPTGNMLTAIGNLFAMVLYLIPVLLVNAGNCSIGDHSIIHGLISFSEA